MDYTDLQEAYNNGEIAQKEIDNLGYSTRNYNIKIVEIDEDEVLIYDATKKVATICEVELFYPQNEDEDDLDNDDDDDYQEFDCRFTYDGVEYLTSECLRANSVWG